MVIFTGQLHFGQEPARSSILMSFSHTSGTELRMLSHGIGSLWKFHQRCPWKFHHVPPNQATKPCFGSLNSMIVSFTVEPPLHFWLYSQKPMVFSRRFVRKPRPEPSQQVTDTRNVSVIEIKLSKVGDVGPGGDGRPWLWRVGETPLG